MIQELESESESESVRKEEKKDIRKRSTFSKVLPKNLLNVRSSSNSSTRSNDHHYHHKVASWSYIIWHVEGELLKTPLHIALFCLFFCAFYFSSFDSIWNIIIIEGSSRHHVLLIWDIQRSIEHTIKFICKLNIL